MGCTNSKLVVATPSYLNISSTQAVIKPAVTKTIPDASQMTLLTSSINSVTTCQVGAAFNREQLNLESHQLIWCDANVNNVKNSEGTVTVDELRKIVDYTKLFDNIHECRHYIQQTGDTNTFLVCSGLFGEKLVPQIDNLKNVVSVYIFCQNKAYHEQWSSQFRKIKHVHSNLQLLLSDLTEDVNGYLKQEKDGIFNEVGREDYTADLDLYWTEFIQMLCHLPYPDNCHQRLVTALRKYYEGKETELNALKEFERTYTSQRAIWWYTRDIFFYRLLNRALRQHNIAVMFLFGFYVKDVHIQLKNEHKIFKNHKSAQLVNKVYRGQIMSIDEIEYITYLTGNDHVITINSFFSTSSDPRQAENFLYSSIISEDYGKVLWTLNLDSRIVSLPFADISHLSAIPTEKEILLMIGMSLKVVKGSYDNERNIHLVELILDDRYKLDDSWNNLTDRQVLKKCFIKLRTKSNSATLQEIDTIFAEISGLFPSDKDWISAFRQQCIGHHYILEKSDEGLLNYKEALKIYERYLDDSELNTVDDILQIHHIVNLYYRNYKKDASLANGYVDERITHFTSTLRETVDLKQRIDLYDTISKLYGMKDKGEGIDNAIKHIDNLELQLKETIKYYSTKHMKVALCYNSLANIQKSITLSEEALVNYEKALKIYLLQDKLDYTQIATIYYSISRIYTEQKEDYSSALRFRKKELEYLIEDSAANAKTLELDKIDKRPIAVCHAGLADIYFKLSQYQLAYDNLAVAKQIYEDSNHPKKKEIAESYEEEMKSLEQLLSVSQQN